MLGSAIASVRLGFRIARAVATARIASQQSGIAIAPSLAALGAIAIPFGEVSPDTQDLRGFERSEPNGVALARWVLPLYANALKREVLMAVSPLQTLWKSDDIIKNDGRKI